MFTEKKKMRNYLSLILAIILADYVLKFISEDKVRNYGAAFDILEGYTFALIFISVLAFVLFLFLFYKYEEYRLGLSFLIGGTLSNLLDRVLFGYVVDYISFSDFFTSNLGDIANVTGVVILFFSFFREPKGKEEEHRVLKRDIKRRYG
ncbi:signal peptidase II [Candidatus Woesearchaeota archaeon]|nr:signal peptidase II [Candidatus Woesearchaeota archaeon]